MKNVNLQVGRIIGKGGANVRDLQRQTGSIIKLPQQGSTSADDTTVHITGTFFSVQVMLFLNFLSDILMTNYIDCY